MKWARELPKRSECLLYNNSYCILAIHGRMHSLCTKLLQTNGCSSVFIMITILGTTFCFNVDNRHHIICLLPHKKGHLIKSQAVSIIHEHLLFNPCNIIAFQRR